MKFSSGTEFHFGTPKYSTATNQFFGSAWFLIIVSQVFPKLPEWISGIGFLMLPVALVVLLIDTIAERKEWEAKRKTETK